MKKKLTISIFLIAALSVVLSAVVGIWIFRQREMSTARSNLTELLALMDAQNYETWTEELLEQFTKAAPEKRLTIIAPDGTVMGDTDAEPQENHTARPEVVLAKKDGVGEDVRRSATTGINTLYVARVFTDGYIGRAAMSLSSVNALVAQTAVGLIVAAVLSLVLAFVLARRLATSTAKPVEEAEVAVRQVDETLQSARSEFTANVTHELKTPLTSIKGFTDMLSSGMVSKPEDQKRFLTMISVEVDRLSTLVDDILTVSELETVAGATGMERAPLMSITREVETILQPQAEKAGVKLNVTGGEVEACIAPDRFKEVAINLMENAIKYNRKGGRVTVTVEPVGNQAYFVVADTGIGIPEESQSRVFERFYRVDKGRSRVAGGTGLGLAIVKHIVALYEGNIKLASVVGSGTTVSVTLPLAKK
ncbi:sensor histidine kinase [Pseudoflavonifractor capillosus]|uniref:sensor histidine kinase n=1 Tax=Pseudoflavonifractor capillosus TaxID=106588 RepID=UPI001FB01D26|nr:ATP-binding protein [Pseudoflavonifractor capillosus]